MLSLHSKLGIFQHYVHPLTTRMITVSPLTHSRVGRHTQRYDGTCRLLACAVILRHDNESSNPHVLVISSSKDSDAWILPKGGWENDETLEECALREAEEEAGIAGKIVRPLGDPLDFVTRQGKSSRLYGFELECVQQYDRWAESNRRREWVTLDEARERLKTRPELLAMLDCVG